MQTTYHLKTSDVNRALIDDIKKRYREDEVLTITIASESNVESSNDLILEFLKIEKKFPLKTVSQNLDFNEVVNEMNT